MFRWLIDWVWSKFVAGCKHDSYDVRADILEGDLDSAPGVRLCRHVQWCQRCGAWRWAGDAQYKGEWRIPRPLWSRPHEERSMRRDAITAARDAAKERT